MFEKLVGVDEKQVMERKDLYFPYIKDLKNWNELPEPCKEADEGDKDLLLRRFFIYSPEFIEFRQVKIDGKLHYTKILYFHDVAFALLYYNDKELKIYKIGCEHDLTMEEIGRCVDEYRCKKCGFVMVVDHSD